MTRKTAQVEPHSVLRLNHRVNQVRNELKNANQEKGLELAKDKLLDSPNTCKTFKKSVAKRTDFAADEKLFKKLQSLDITNEAALEKPKRVANLPIGKRDEEPRLEDFHQPFQGEPVPMTLHSKDILDRIKAKLTKSDDEDEKSWLGNYLEHRDKYYQNDF